MAGESLLNDGFGLMLFVLFLGVATRGQDTTLERVTLLFAREVVGGVLFGLAVGYAAHRLLAAIDGFKIKILLTLALVMGGYTLALALHVSGPISIVVAGLLVGNYRRNHTMTPASRERLESFWELIDEILIAVLFVMIGLELLRLKLQPTYLWAALAAIPAVLAARFLSIALATAVPRLRREFPPYAIGVLTWGGLRGGISVALALSLPPSRYRDAIITVTYVVVLFSILVQGMTLSWVLRRRA
jgi:monovalent cation:H+ antiporter, CPA1 family